MNESQAKKLSEELAKSFESVGFQSGDGINYSVIVSGRVKATPPGRSCDTCRNRIICLVNLRISEVIPIIAVATFNMSIGDKIKTILANECERFAI